MDDQFDAVKQAAHARQVTDWATKARTALNDKIVADAERLGLERNRAARRAQSAESERAAAEQQAQRELRVAADADKAAAGLEKRAADANKPDTYHSQELREQAAAQRGRAEAARRRAHEADQEADRLVGVVNDSRQTVTALEAQMKSTTQMDAIEQQVDLLEYHARTAEAVAASARRVQELEGEIATAKGLGETVRAAKLAQELDLHKTTVVANTALRPNQWVDRAALHEIGIELPIKVLHAPGADAPAVDPTTLDERTTTGVPVGPAEPAVGGAAASMVSPPAVGADPDGGDATAQTADASASPETTDDPTFDAATATSPDGAGGATPAAGTTSELDVMTGDVLGTATDPVAAPATVNDGSAPPRAEPPATNAPAGEPPAAEPPVDGAAPAASTSVDERVDASFAAARFDDASTDMGDADFSGPEPAAEAAAEPAADVEDAFVDVA